MPLTAVAAELSRLPAAYRDRRWMEFVDELLLAWDDELGLLWEALSEERIEGLLEHAQRVVQSSQSTEKVRLAARIVAAAVAGRSVASHVDKADAFLALLSGLESYHLEVFAVVAAPRPGDGQLSGHAVMGGWSTSDLQRAVPQVAEELVPVLLSTLASLGLVIDSGAASVTYGGLGRASYGPTDAGRWLFEHLKAHRAAS